MIKNFRLKLTIYFVVLSTIVYALMAICAVIFFRGVQTKSLDDRLSMLASEVGHAIDIDVNAAKLSDTSAKPVASLGPDLTNNASNVTPRLRDWQRRVTTDPLRGLASAELFDRHGNLLEFFGPEPVHKFFKLAGEAKEGGRNFRLIYTPLKLKGDIIGYVQVDTTTRSRDSSVETLIATLCWLGPLVVVGLGLISYYVSGIAAKPLLANMATMRRFIEDAGHELNTPLSIVRAQKRGSGAAPGCKWHRGTGD